MMTGAKETNALIPIVAALWLSGGVAISSTQMINERRDAVMLGFLNGRQLSSVHREAILYHDWLPLVLVMGLSSLMLASFFIIAPFALKMNRPYKILCFVCAASPIVGLVGWAWGGIREYHMMQSVLAAAPGAAAAVGG